jgi:hypothetical protein
MNIGLLLFSLVSPSISFLIFPIVVKDKWVCLAISLVDTPCSIKLTANSFFYLNLNTIY